MELHRWYGRSDVRLSLLLLFSAFVVAQARSHNVTRLLARHPSFSTFNHYLSLTLLAADINARTPTTVLAVDNAVMSGLLSSSHPDLGTLKDILSYQVLLDYFGGRKLRQIAGGSALSTTLLQASGSLEGSTGLVNITVLKNGKVAFGPEDNDGVLDVYFLQALEEVPYKISVIQISKFLPSAAIAAAASAPASAPDPARISLTALMHAHGCKEFADTLSANSDASNTYKDNVEGGLTVFCPSDDTFKAFQPKYKNLSAADRVSFLEFYAVPIYMSMDVLRSSNGPMNTLATDGAKKFDLTVQNDGQDVTLKTNATTVRISTTAAFDHQPLAIYSTDGVLLPGELFKSSTASPSPAHHKAVHAPKAAEQGPSPGDSPAYSPDDDVADQSADTDSAASPLDVGGGGLHVAVFLLSAVIVLAN
ncbi:hypothetical protein SAY87_005052 [Trapa incisa]|uniref:FAS1 domain-containing protein n=1 Tax=Trapa incisa TaxID=236973 RepID=A0AAN7JQ93_9MYRT|nr:hypothetical protein SAY87_005052 [Trapa incisa]